jgi:hypothetical protein
LTSTNSRAALVPLLPSRIVLYRERGKKEWARLRFTILGKKSFLTSARSTQPMQLTLETDVDGFRSVEIAGMDLFSAIASALLSAESILLQQRTMGEVRLNEESEFDVETDAIFFSSRVQRLRQTFESR